MKSVVSSVKIEEVKKALKSVLDPEIGLNIVDLGLIYSIEIEEGRTIVVEMTLTTAGCPMGDVILNDANDNLRENFGDHEIQINLVWEPAWNNDMISPDGLKFLGY